MKWEHLKFEEGKVNIGGVPCFLTPVNTFIVLYRTLLKEQPNIIEAQLKEIEKIGFCVGENICGGKKIPINNKITLFLEILNSFGYGEISLITYSSIKRKIVFKCENSSFSKNFHGFFGKEFDENKSMDFFPEYFIKGFLKRLFLTRIENVSFWRNGVSHFEYDLTDEKIVSDIDSRNYSIEKIENSKGINDLMKKILINNHFQCESGQLMVWGMNLYAIPLESLEIEEILSSKKCLDLFKLLGVTQGKAAYLIIVNKFGSKKKFDIFQNIYRQTDMMGVGSTRILDFSEENKFVKLYFEGDTIIKENKPTVVGTFMLNDFRGVIENLFDHSIKIEIKSQEVSFVEEERDLVETNYEEKYKEAFEKHMGIKAIYSK